MITLKFKIQGYSTHFDGKNHVKKEFKNSNVGGNRLKIYAGAISQISTTLVTKISVTYRKRFSA